MRKNENQILIVAGEPSGDLHGSNVIKEIKKISPEVKFYGIGGELMNAVGMQLIYHINELSIIGFSDVLRKIPLVKSVERTLSSLMKVKPPKAVILIDFPGLNLRIAKQAKKLKVPVLYYIAPQVWAWGRRRIKKMKNLVDEVYLILPFEKTLYDKEEIKADFVGHPILDLIGISEERKEFCKRHKLDPDRRIIALFPGSRPPEIKNHMSVMARAANILRDELGVQPVIGASQNLPLNFIRYHLPGNADDIPVIQDETYKLLRHADFAFVKSGTTTLEAACFQTPMVVVYRTSRINYLIGRALINIKYFSLVNILAGEEVVKELSQGKVNVEELVRTGRELLTNSDNREIMKRKLKEVKEQLGEPGAAERVAKNVLLAAGIK